MKKIILVFLLAISLVTLTACNKPVVEEVSYTVTFNSNEGSAVADLDVTDGELAVEPAVPNKEGFVFVLWYETDDTVEFDFSVPITGDVTLNGLWEEEIYEMTDEDRINEDIAGYEAEMYFSDDLLNTPLRGSVYGSRITWSTDSQYISKEGIILPIPSTEEEMTGHITGKFTLNDTVVSKTFDVPLFHVDEVVIDNFINLPFENLTTEYEVEDTDINIYFEEDGSVPYVKVVDFWNLLTGLVDPELDVTITTDSGVLVIFYQYYDEDEDVIYDMILTIDSFENTIGTNDPAFYWASQAAIETNHGRNYYYDRDNPDASFDEGHEVTYDLDDYFMDVVMYEDEVVIPLYMANQLLAASGYYNVYYNGDGLFGIYSLPEDGSEEMRTIMRSSMNNEDIPADLLIHTFHMLAFDFDNLYGLKELMGVETYYDLLYSKKDDLLVQDPEDFDYAIRDLLLKSIGDPHTSYGYRSYFNKTTWDGPETNNLSDYGTRMQDRYYNGYFAVDDVLAAKWGYEGTGWAATSTNRPNYWFLDDVSVVLSLDDFNTADIDESSVFDVTYVEQILDIDDASGILPVITEGNKFFYYNNSDQTAKVLEILVKGV
ncbi:MAG: InlB B-repeat-containing protein, partial [Candidatus Izimaplasma sp.]|nr:InlB B-repeat-containing protein [Candidatus Izimaplasma bacterium]